MIDSGGMEECFAGVEGAFELGHIDELNSPGGVGEEGGYSRQWE